MSVISAADNAWFDNSRAAFLAATWRSSVHRQKLTEAQHGARGDDISSASLDLDERIFGVWVWRTVEGIDHILFSQRVFSVV